MTVWYKIVDFLLPFQWAEFDFMKNALLGVLLVTPMFGLLGTLVVNNKMGFFSDALGHSALTGIAIGVILGIKNPLWSMLGFSVILAVVIVKVKNVNTASTDTIIGVFSSIAVALGIAILSFRGGFTKYSTYLIGDLLSIKSDDMLLLGVTLIVVIFIWIFLFNKLLLVSVNHSLASSRGIKINFYEYMFTIIVAVIVTVSIQWVGVLIINSMLLLPAASARNIAGNIRQYHVYSVLIAVFSGVSGLLLSYFLGTASGATIVLISSLFFAATFFKKILS
ncbi:MAG: metal ABC transporter permease [Clostridiaceae bacterium]